MPKLLQRRLIIMKKKLFALMLASTIMLAGCSGKSETTTENTTSTTEVTIEATPEVTTETTSEDTTEAISNKSLNGLATYLLDKGVVSGTTDTPLYEYIGAIGGFKYLDSDVEVYEYDTSSDTYKSILDTNSVSGLTVSAVNGPYILIFSNGNSNQDVIDAFNNY